MMKISHLRKEYDSVTPLKDICTEINKGEVISIIGPSGTGKSTLLRCTNLLETPTRGEIVVDGETITDKKCKIHLVRRKMGMVFQGFHLFNHMTIIENVMSGQVDLSIPQKIIYRFQEVFEELCVQILLPKLSNEVMIQITAEYSQEEACMSLRVRYNGRRFDPVDSDNSTAMKLIQHASSKIEYIGYEDGMNTVVLDIKEYNLPI